MTIVLYTLIISLFSDNSKQFEIENIHLAKNEIFPDRLFIMNRKDQNKITSWSFNSNRSIIYVDSFVGNDSFMGTISRPKKTIQAAIHEARNHSNKTHVYVASGYYRERINLPNSISLYGGYARSKWNKRRGSTVIIPPESTMAKSNATVSIHSDVNRNTILDGFSIVGGAGLHSTAIWINSDASPIIQNNMIQGGSGKLTSRSIFCNACKVHLKKNKIFGGNGKKNAAVWMDASGSDLSIENNIISGGTGNISIGLLASDITYLGIQDNIIHGGDGSISTIGIYVKGKDLEDSSVLIRKNRIISGDGSGNNYGILHKSSSTIEIEQNLIFGGTGAYSYGIYNEVSSQSYIASNQINGGTGDQSTGIYDAFHLDTPSSKECTSKDCISDSSYNGSIILNNLIWSGGSSISSFSIGIDTNTSSIIRNNTIHSGESLTSIGIKMSDTGRAIIENNILLGDPDHNSYCLYESGGYAEPSSIRYNVLYNCNSALYYGTKKGDIIFISNINDGKMLGERVYAEGNLNIDPVLQSLAGKDSSAATMMDNDWNISYSTSINISKGGINFSQDELTPFDMDIKCNKRDQYWSIGAYQYENRK